MSRRQKNPLRPLTGAERSSLARLSRSQGAPAAQVARARALLAVAEGRSYTAAAQLVGRQTGDTVARWVAGFNRDGLTALVPRHGGGHPIRYGAADPLRRGGAAAHPGRSRPGAGAGAGRHGDLVADHAAGCPAPGGGRPSRRQHPHDRPRAAHRRLHLAERAELVRDRRGRAQAQARRSCHRHRSGCRRQKGLIERAYTLGASLGLAVWCADEAGPFQAVPHPGSGWRPRGHPATLPHEYVRGGTCKVLTLFHPATGQVHLQPVGSCTNPVLHGWLKDELTMILAALPAPAA